MNDEQRRSDLARFLRARRARLTPQQVGLPQGGRRRTPGLRREEVADLAGVGVSWYTWLEQGRPITASVPVLDSLARVLRLDAVERAHLFLLARGEVPASAPPVTEQVGPAVQQILDALGAYPAYVVNARWDVVAWNEAACHVFTDFATLTPRERNLLRFLFTHPLPRHLYVDWAGAARRTLALVRASTGPYLGELWFAALVEEMSNASPEFAAWWPCGDVSGIPEGGKELNHPVVGRLALQPTPLQVAQMPDLWMIVYTPLAGTQAAVKLQHLLRPRHDGDNA
jgi:transcriptional regulator with XRE-family HTH domain